MTKTTRRAFLLFCTFALLVVLVGCASQKTPAFRLDAYDQPLYLFYPGKDVKLYTGETSARTGKIALVSPSDKSVIQVLKDNQRSFVQMPLDERKAKFSDRQFRIALSRGSYWPNTVTLAWTQEYLPARETRVVIAENETFKNAVSVRPLAEQPGRLLLRNLKIGTTYYWKVQVDDGNRIVESAVSSFTTEGLAPRSVGILGVPNVRDLGGRLGLGGKRVKQGWIYRTAGLNENASRTTLTQEQIQERFPEVNCQAEQLDRKILELTQKMTTEPSVTLVPFSMSDTWTIFAPSEKYSLKACHRFVQKAANDRKVLGVTGKSAHANPEGYVLLGVPEMEKMAFLVNTIDAEGDGFIQLDCKGDWYWCLAVNGQIEADCLFAGNGFGTSHLVEVPVKKGKNTLAVAVRSGSQGFGFGLRKPSAPISHTQAQEMRIARLKLQKEALFKNQATPVPGNNRLNDYMKEYMTQTLGIKTDVDLRNHLECYGMEGSPMGDCVAWHQLSSSSYAGMALEGGKSMFAKTFRLFLEEKNYPIVFHCIGGRDRTGAVAFILNALLGVELNELYLDWEATGFYLGNPGFNHKNNFDKLVEVFDPLPGKTMTEKVESYVLSCGLTYEDIGHFRALMLE